MPTSLRTLQSTLAPTGIGNVTSVFWIGSTQGTSNAASSDGCCCLWTVTANIRSVTFEVWGAGGDGAGGCCCMSTAIGSVSGSYAVTTVDTVPGRQFRICSAPSGCCTATCDGLSSNGAPSYVFDVNAGANIVCACGGQGANMRPTFTGSGEGYTCCWGRLGNGGYAQCGYVVCGTGGTGFRNQFCHSDQYQMVSGGFSASGRLSPDRCSIWACQGCAIMKSAPSWPGGSGADGNACGGGFCSGQWGAPGSVKVTYR